MLLAIILALLGAFYPCAAGAAGSTRLIVTFTQVANPAERARVLSRSGVVDRSIESIHGLSSAVVDVPAGDVHAVAARLSEQPGVVGVEVDHVAHAYWAPNDPKLSSQWGLQAMHVFDAWNITRGTGATVAVVDTGVNDMHPDLWGKVQRGRDFVDNDSDPSDEQGHGTHVAGIAAGLANNGQGGAGVAPAAQVLAVRVLDANGEGQYSWIASGITWAADQGVDVINLSLGGPEGSEVMRSAVEYATARGTLVTCATGNDGAANIGYPARYPGCLAVGASNRSDQRAGFSNYGSGIDVVAPGTSILSSTMDGGYEAWDGTSMATPFASGLAALLYGEGLSARQVRSVLVSTAKDIGAPGPDRVTGSGRIDAAAALGTAGSLTLPSADAVVPTVGSVTAGARFTKSAHKVSWRWKRAKSTGWRVVGSTEYSGVYRWKEVKRSGNVRTTFFFRMSEHKVRRRSVRDVRRKQVKTVRSAWAPVTVQATDNTAVDRVGLSLDGRFIGTDWNGTDGWRVDVPCSSGRHNVTAHAFDARDNRRQALVSLQFTC